MEEWREKGRKLFSRRVYLQAGQFYAIRLDYANYRDGGYVDLDWEMPQKVDFATYGFIPERTVIPTAYLFSDSAATPKILSPSPTGKPALTATRTHPKKTVLRSAVATPLRTKPVPAPATPLPVNRFDGLEATPNQTLDNVIFEQSSYLLLPQSYPELNQLANALKRSPALRIEVSGHTDDVGDPRLNQILSEYRAKVVATYLIRHGVAENRINAQGHGGSRPLVPNTSNVNRARNRRVEIEVMHEITQ
jgi:outer membrane protein OmpA-like peptidoglycan-associated protein